MAESGRSPHHALRLISGGLCLIALGVGLAAADRASASPQRSQGDYRIYMPLGLRRADIPILPIATFGPPTSTLVPTIEPTATITPTETIQPSPTPTETPIPTPTTAGYTEPLTDHPKLDDLRGGYSAAKWYETLLAVLDRRYETGKYIVTHLANSKQQAQRWASGHTDTFDNLLDISQLVVHEMNHQLGMQEGVMATSFQTYAYVVRSDLTVKVPYRETFPRSEIAQYVKGPLDNMYKSTYLTGTSGQQGFLNLEDELNAYTHSMFMGYGLEDYYRGHHVSHRDGLVTFMMYTEFYLRQGRLKHPDDYQGLRDDAGTRDLVKLLWDRAMFILDVTKDMDYLSMNPKAVEAEMRKPDMLSEVDQFVAP